MIKKHKILTMMLVFAGTIGVCLILYLSAGVSAENQEKGWPGRDVNSGEAYALWKSEPDNIVILDVRTQPEYAMIGHPPMAYNIPLAFWTDRFEPTRRNYIMINNQDFVKQVEKRFSKETKILLLCRSGHRSGAAATILRNAGFSNAYNIVDGFQGKPTYDRQGNIRGYKTNTGWKNSGVPWTYELNPGLIYSP